MCVLLWTDELQVRCVDMTPGVLNLRPASEAGGVLAVRRCKLYCERASRVHGRSYLIPELLREVSGLVQRETGHQRRGEDMLAAQLVNHIRDIEERVILQQLSATQTATRHLNLTHRF